MAMIDILITTILPFFLITIINILIAYKLKTETKKAKKCKKQIRLSKNDLMIHYWLVIKKKQNKFQ